MCSSRFVALITTSVTVSLRLSENLQNKEVADKISWCFFSHWLVFPLSSLFFCVVVSVSMTMKQTLIFLLYYPTNCTVHWRFFLLQQMFGVLLPARVLLIVCAATWRHDRVELLGHFPSYLVLETGCHMRVHCWKLCLVETSTLQVGSHFFQQHVSGVVWIYYLLVNLATGSDSVKQKQKLIWHAVFNTDSIQLTFISCNIYFLIYIL